MSLLQRPHLRETAARVSRIGAVALLALGLTLAYANRVVFDPGAFADRAALSLGDPRVAGFVGDRAADGVIAQNRDLVAVRPVLTTVARSVVGSDAFRALFRQASRSAHALALSEGAERVALSLPDFGVLLRGTLSELVPGLAEQVETGSEVAIIEDLDQAMGAGVLELLRFASELREWTHLALGLGLALLLVSVALPPDRRRALLRAGGGLALAGLVLVVLPSLLGAALTARIADHALRDAARGVWDAFAGGFRLWALLLGGLGLVLAAAASSFASHVEVERAVAGAWRWLREPRGGVGGELARALGLLTVGLLAFLAPGVTVDLLAALLGAILAFEGLRSLFALIAPQLEEAAGRAEEAARVARAQPAAGRRVRLATVVALSAALVGAGLLFLRSPSSVPALGLLVTACNGDRKLCDRPLDEVVLAGAHNAMAAADVPGWMFPNHENGIPRQLEAGYRAFLIDVYGGTPVGGRVRTDLSSEAARQKFDSAIGREDVDAALRIRDRLVGEPDGPRALYLCHGFCEIGADPLVPVLSGIRDFLVEHPGEVLAIVIEDYVPPEEIAAAFEESGLLRLVYQGPVARPWPTLRQLIARDQRVLVFAEKNSAGVPWYHPAFEVLQETPYHFTAPGELSCEANRGGTGGSLFQINHWIDTTPTPKPSNAEIVNARGFLLGRARQCQEERGMLPNIVAVDFALTGDVVGAVAELNGLN